MHRSNGISYIIDLIPPDVVAETLQLLDARDLLRMAAGLRRRFLLPARWAFQAQRPLTEAEQTGLVGVGVPHVQLWPECPTHPVGELTELDAWRRNTVKKFSFAWRRVCVFEDERGTLYKFEEDRPYLLCITESELEYDRPWYPEFYAFERARRAALAQQRKQQLPPPLLLLAAD